MSRATDLHELITSIQDRHEVSESEESQFPYLGLFYVIFEELYWEGTPIKYAEDSSHFKIYPKIHPTFWTHTIVKNNPELNKFDPYYFSRGRVVYDKNLNKYELVADKCILRNEKIISEIIVEMRLPRNNINILGDAHYECSKCKEDKFSKLKSEIDKLTVK